MDYTNQKQKNEKMERRILLLSFFGGLAFAIAEFIFAIFSHSQSSLTDAVYDASELVFIALMVFITPLFYKPVSENHPYGYSQLETVFMIVKNVMLISVTFSVLASVIECAVNGGNSVNGMHVALFQLVLGIASILVYCLMLHMNRSLTSEMIEAELMGWKLDIFYSLGMSLAFFGSLLLKKTSLAFLAPYFDPIMAVVVMIFMLPECVKMLITTIREALLFSPNSETVQEVKEICTKTLMDYGFKPVFFDVIKTGRHLWVTIYYEYASESIPVQDLDELSFKLNQNLHEHYGDSTCELIKAQKNYNIEYV